MGSPVSFPILCLVNLAVTLVGLDQHFGDSPIAVNGDDIAFVCDQVQYEQWKGTVTKAGLKPSIGKNYTSRQFVIMNSELRRVPDTRRSEAFLERSHWEPLPDGGLEEVMVSKERPVPWKFEGYLNQSLSRGIVRKGLEAGQPDWRCWSELSEVAFASIRGIGQKYTSAFMRIFVQCHSESLRLAPVIANRYIPLSLGGLGLPYTGGPKSDSDSLLETQRKVAGFLMCSNRRTPSLAPRTLAGPMNESLARQRERYARQDGLCRRPVSFWKAVQPSGGPRDVAQLLADGIRHWHSNLEGGDSSFTFCSSETRSREWLSGESQRLRTVYRRWTDGWVRYSCQLPTDEKLFHHGWEPVFEWVGNGSVSRIRREPTISSDDQPMRLRSQWWDALEFLEGRSRSRSSLPDLPKLSAFSR